MLVGRECRYSAIVEDEIVTLKPNRPNYSHNDGVPNAVVWSDATVPPSGPHQPYRRRPSIVGKGELEENVQCSLT